MNHSVGMTINHHLLHHHHSPPLEMASCNNFEVMFLLQNAIKNSLCFSHKILALLDMLTQKVYYSLMNVLHSQEFDRMYQ